MAATGGIERGIAASNARRPAQLDELAAELADEARRRRAVALRARGMREQPPMHMLTPSRAARRDALRDFSSDRGKAVPSTQRPVFRPGVSP